MAWTEQCKIEACQHIKTKIEGGLTVRKALEEIAEEIDIPANTLSGWLYPRKKKPKNKSQKTGDPKGVVKTNHKGDVFSDKAELLKRLSEMPPSLLEPLPLEPTENNIDLLIKKNKKEIKSILEQGSKFIPLRQAIQDLEEAFEKLAGLMKDDTIFNELVLRGDLNAFKAEIPHYISFLLILCPSLEILESTQKKLTVMKRGIKAAKESKQ